MNRNQLTTIGVGILLGLILLFVVLASCSPDGDGETTGQPGSSVSGSPLPSIAPSGTLPVEEPPPSEAGTPSGTLPPDAGETTEPTRTQPVATRTPAGGVDAGGGSGVSGRRMALLVTGTFLLMAAVGTAGYAVRRPGRG